MFHTCDYLSLGVPFSKTPESFSNLTQRVTSIYSETQFFDLSSPNAMHRMYSRPVMMCQPPTLTVAA